MDFTEDDVAKIGRIDAVPTILDVICRTTGMGFAAVARVTESRWVACALLDNIDFGLKPGGELKVETTICHEIRQANEAVVIDDVDTDDVYCNHPTPAMYGFKSYISVPIVLDDGTFFGTLCAIDPKPHVLRTPGITGMFALFAQMIASHLNADQRVRQAESNLADERAVAILREQFIAVLGHDLRNPLSALSSGTRLIEREVESQKARAVLDLMQASIFRMSGLIDNVLDFARGRLGGGLNIERDASEPLEPVLHQVVQELRVGAPDRAIETDYDISHPILADRSRIGQLFSNLVGNALMHGKPDVPVRVRARSDGQTFELIVANAGDAIPAAAMERMFQPFFRGEVRRSQQGLGLGLHIASEIAKAHGGEITVTSDDVETLFTFRMPI